MFENNFMYSSSILLLLSSIDSFTFWILEFSFAVLSFASETATGEVKVCIPNIFFCTSVNSFNCFIVDFNVSSELSNKFASFSAGKFNVALKAFTCSTKAFFSLAWYSTNLASADSFNLFSLSTLLFNFSFSAFKVLTSFSNSAILTLAASNSSLALLSSLGSSVFSSASSSFLSSSLDSSSLDSSD